MSDIPYNFTKSGYKITFGREDELEEIFNGLVWIEVTNGTARLPFMAGAVMTQALKDLPGGRMSHYALSSAMPRHELVAIRRHGFKGGPVEIFLADTGSDICPVLASRQRTDLVEVLA